MNSLISLRNLFLALVIGVGMAPSAYSYYKRGTVKDVQRVIKAGIQYYRKHGAEKAFEKFNYDPVPEFFKGDTILAVISQGEEGVIMANPDDLDSVGTKVKDKQDLRGSKVGRALIRKVAELKAASKKGGWLKSFYFVNPVTNEAERLRSFIYLYDGYIFASGIFLEND